MQKLEDAKEVKFKSSTDTEDFTNFAIKQKIESGIQLENLMQTNIEGICELLNLRDNDAQV